MVAKRGPVPNRSEERQRTNVDPALVKIDAAKALQAGIDMHPRRPPAHDRWSTAVQEMYAAFARSPGVLFAYAFDWQLAWQLCDQWDRNMKAQFVGFETKVDHDTTPATVTTEAVYAVVPMKAATLTALLNGFRALGMTEEARRRMSIEAPPLEQAAQAALAPEAAEVVSSFEQAQAARAARRLG